MDRAYSFLQIKAIDRDQRLIEGIASTPDIDRGGDSMDPAGAEFTLPLPFLWFHDALNPIGEVFAADVRDDGIHIKARVSKVIKPGRLKTLVDEAWSAFTADPPLVRGLSIGWSPLEIAPAVKGSSVRRIARWVWGELSAVTIPMNIRTTITAIKSFDTPAVATSRTRPAVPSLPGVTGQRTDRPMNISEQLTTEKSTLQIKSTRLEELMTADQAEGGLEADEQTELGTLTTEIKSLTAKVDRLAALEAAQASQAGALAYAPAASRPAPRPRVEVVPLAKGTLFTRYAMAVAAGKGSLSDTMAYAKRWANTPEVLQYIKAEAGTVSSLTPGWGSELVYQENLVSEFVELLRPATILGRLNGTRTVPPNVRIPVQNAGSTVNWVGEEAAKPVTDLGFTTLSVGDHKIAGIIVMTDELVRSSRPSAEGIVRSDLIKQIAQFSDEQLLDATITATVNRPASITNGVASPAASGTDITALFIDLNTALATFDNAETGTETIHILMPPALARGISTLRNSLGQTEQGINVSPQGGTLLGFPVIVSGSVPDGTIVLVKADEILIAEEGPVTLDASNQATLDMAGGSTPTFSLWQKNCTGVRAERRVSWLKRRSAAVAIIDTATYGPAVGSP